MLSVISESIYFNSEDNSYYLLIFYIYLKNTNFTTNEIKKKSQRRMYYCVSSRINNYCDDCFIYGLRINGWTNNNNNRLIQILFT